MLAGSEHRESLSSFWIKILVLIYLYRCFCSIFAQVVIGKLTSIGDTTTFQRGIVERYYDQLSFYDVLVRSLDPNNFQMSAVITTRLGGLMGRVFFGNEIMINLGFQTIAFIGIAYLLTSVAESQRLRLAMLLVLPTFSIWTSMASKEAIVVFAVGVLTGYILRLYNQPVRFGLLHFVALAVLYVFKPHYLIAIGYFGVVTKIAEHIHRKAFMALLLGMASLIVLYVFRDAIDSVAFRVQHSFNVSISAGSTRDENFFTEQYDVFFLFPMGFYRAFVGPTIAEAISSPLHLATFIESMALVSILAYFIISRLPNLPAYSFIVGVFVAFWAFFPNYAFGVMNSGSAIRYRTGWIILIFAAFAILQSRKLYLDWSRPVPPPKSARERSA